MQEEGQGSVLSHVRTSILWPINFVKMSSFLEGSSLVHRNPGTSLLFLTMLWSWSSLRSTSTHPTLYGALDHLGSPPIPKALEMSCTSSCFGFGSNLSDFGRRANDTIVLQGQWRGNSGASSLHKRAHRPVGDEPTPTRELFVMVLNLSATTRSKTFCLQRTNHHLGKDNCKDELRLEATSCSTTNLSLSSCARISG